MCVIGLTMQNIVHVLVVVYSYGDISIFVQVWKI